MHAVPLRSKGWGTINFGGVATAGCRARRDTTKAKYRCNDGNDKENDLMIVRDVTASISTL